MNGNLFTIEKVSVSDEMLRYSAHVDEFHPVFAGHFPGTPVVPGVCTMNMIKQCLGDALGRPVRYDYVKECKFLSAIIPVEHRLLDVSIAIKRENEAIDIIAEVAAGQTKMMKLKATMI